MRRLTGQLPYVLTSVDQLYSSVDYEVSTVRSVGQDGSTPVSASFAERKMTLEFTVAASDRSQLRGLVDHAMAVLNPAVAGQLTLDTPLGLRRIAVRPDGTPALSLKNAYCVAVEVDLTAYSPYFTAEEEQKTEVATVVGGLVFPIELDAGWMVGERMRAQMVNVCNPGHAPCGLRIVLTADGTVSDPEVYNITTGQMLRICKDVLAGEWSEILSEPDCRRIVSRRRGEQQNLMGLLDVTSDFPQLAVGDNLFRCGATAGGQNLRVTVYSRPVYML